MTEADILEIEMTLRWLPATALDELVPKLAEKYGVACVAISAIVFGIKHYGERPELK